MVRVWRHEAQCADGSSPPTGASVSRGATMPCSWLVRGGVGAPTHAAALNPEVRAAGIGLQDGRRDSCSIQPIACHGPTWSTFGMQGKLEAVSAAAGASKASPLWPVGAANDHYHAVRYLRRRRMPVNELHCEVRDAEEPASH
jgi:hypothetical protein